MPSFGLWIASLPTMKYIFIIFSVLSIYTSRAQDNSRYTRFINQFDTASGREQKLRYARLWRDQARLDSNRLQEVAALREIMYNDRREFLTQYSDTLLFAALQTKNKAIIGQAYLTKGIAHYSRNQHNDALNAYLKADEYLSDSGARYDIYKLKYGIGNTKYYLGYYHEAIALYKQCLEHYRDKDERGYLNAIYSLSLSYNRLGDFEQSRELSTFGLKEEIRLGCSKMHWYLIYSNGVNDFFLGKYKTSVDQLEQSAQYLKAAGDYSNLAVIWFYLGKSNLALKNQEKALVYFKKVDSSFHDTQYIRPDLRQTYDILIAHYIRNKDFKSENYYTRRSRIVDSVLNSDFKYLVPKVVKEYDNRELNRNYRDALESQAVKTYAIIGFSVLLIYFFVKNRRLRAYRRNYRKLMDQPLDTSVHAPKCDDAETVILKSTKLVDKEISIQDMPKIEKEIRPDVVAKALVKLSLFESTEKFRDSGLMAKDLADFMETNLTYAQQIIQQHRGMNSKEYVRDLRLRYIVKKLRTENRYRKYTDEALAGECGFGSTQNFARAFKAKYEMPPRFFISQLKKDLGED